MSLEDRYLEIKNNPEKRGKAFKIIWLVGYFMLLLGAFLTVYFLWDNLYN
jgi:predicted nucleic acid-binding Zn ribbon protein